MPDFPHTHVKAVSSWSNYSGTISGRAIPVYCTPEGGTDASVLRAHGDALKAILGYCFAQKPAARLFTPGSSWSFSRVVEPGDVALDTANMNYIARIPVEHLDPAYRARVGGARTPVFVEGGTQIGALNRRLAQDVRLALQTSGAGDGHRIAGAIATGTHGAALQIGALHDTVLGMYLVVAPNRAVLVQGGAAPFATPSLAAWLEGQTGIPTEHVADDDALNAARVSLGSLGVVLGVIVETVPLYQLKYRGFSGPAFTPAIWAAIQSPDLDTSALHPEIAEKPYHFDVVMHPYPKDNQPGLFATLMWKVSADGIPATAPLPTVPLVSSDTMGLASRLAQALGSSLTAPLALPLIQSLITQELGSRGTGGGQDFPGTIFGPSTLPPGTGASTEIVVHQGLAAVALNAVYTVLQEQQALGHFLLGVIGVRFVPATSALLGMNVNPMNCYIELPSVRDENVLRIYEAIWNLLEKQNIPFTCHWGQLSGMNAARLAKYFGAERVEAWRRTRRKLLIGNDGDETALQVFAAPILADVGLA